MWKQNNLKKNYTLILLIAFKWPIFVVSVNGEIYIFYISSKKKFYNINSRGQFHKTFSFVIWGTIWAIKA